jgi:hypothetical protein
MHSILFSALLFPFAVFTVSPPFDIVRSRGRELQKAVRVVRQYEVSFDSGLPLGRKEMQSLCQDFDAGFPA